MPRTVATVLVNNFVNGFVTEATPLSWPENAVTDAINMEFDHTGKMAKRRGLQREQGGATDAFPDRNGAASSYLWNTSYNGDRYTFYVFQNGNFIYFWQASSNGVLSGNQEAFTINLNTYSTHANRDPEDYESCFATGRDLLFISNPVAEPLYVEYTGAGITVTENILQIRDFQGVSDSLTPGQRPGTLSMQHLYNLRNQGWGEDQVSVSTSDEATDPLTYVKTKDDPIGFFQLNSTGTVYPSNKDIWWLFKDQWGAMNSNWFDKVHMAGSVAPKGSIVLNAFEQDRNVQGVTGLPDVTSAGFRPSAVAFFAGRVFYAGTPHRLYNTYVYFSRIVEKESHFSQCYQDLDPTSESYNDILPHDGGVISIPDIDTIVDMVTYGNSLYILATNGIWAITGSEGIGFTATDYAVVKVSGVGLLSRRSITLMEGLPVWWNLDGIYTMSPSETGGMQIQNISEGRIRSFFDDIPSDCKRYATGAYNPLTRHLQWLYNSEDVSGASVTDKYRADRVLTLNLTTGAFYVWSVSGQPFLVDVVCLSHLDQTTSTKFKFLVKVTGGVSFGEFIDNDYIDWFNLDNNTDDYDAYAISGYSLLSQANKKFQSNYVNFYFTTLNSTSCMVQGMWDTSNLGDSGRWTNPQEAYKPKPHYNVQTSRLKIRGQGKSLRLKLQAGAGKPLEILGWSVYVTANQGP